MKHEWPLVLGVLATLAAPAIAQPRIEVRDPRATGQYAGVAPENQHTPPRHGAVQRSQRGTLITWPGFQIRTDGGSRFFLQVSQAPQTELVRTQGRFELLVRRTRTHLRNTRRPLETRFFNTPVTRARIERRSDDLAFVFDVRADVTPSVTQQAGANGYHFVIVDFPPGTYVDGPPLPPPPRAPNAAYPQEEDVGDLTPESEQPEIDTETRALPPRGMRDEERPPGM